MGFDIHVCSMHWLRDLVISYSLFGAYSHCVWVRFSCWNIYRRLSIARFCLSKKVVFRFWRLLGRNRVYDLQVVYGDYCFFDNYGVGG